MDQDRNFATTHWTVIRNVSDNDSSIANQALEQLCQRYWMPLYGFVRFRGYDRSEAEDLTQAFFADLLQRQDLQRADPEKGRFRTFLLSALKNFLANQWNHENRLKRGGGKTVFSMDFAKADNRFELESQSEDSPESLFERQWALNLLDHVMKLLEREFDRRGKNTFLRR